MKKNNEENNFLELLRLNDKEKLKKFILENGKEHKPYSPIIFVKEEENNDSKSDI